MVQQPKLIFPPLQLGPANGMFQGCDNIPMMDTWKASTPSPCGLWPAYYKEADDDADTTEYTATQKSSAGSSCGDDDWNSHVRSNLAGEIFPGERFGASDADDGRGLVDLDPEVGRQRGQELLAMLHDGPLSKGACHRGDPGGSASGLGFGPSEQLLSTAMLGQQSRQSFSRPWVPLGTVAAQGIGSSQVTNWAL